ncbi:TetR/AcrR family transcriptional regulator [Cryobacterium sp. MLB-32]|uniref:TetR/AcrR family transcriptional regulator n=1 Tax=Cryobacterium sp. MLB-32 TaxID=1529318 RepID=UPI00068C9476|nr:TetR/AcrR family transcriptional regulator [Cryobacterium sp. MLB-32]
MATESNAPNLGLRDRKRLETRARLEDAAVTLVLRDGLEHTTVDAISELADVSPRTFFNYFESKDAAIIGLRHVEVAPEDLAAHCDRVDEYGTIASVVHLLIAVMGPPSTRATMREDRLEILRRHPHLMAAQLAQFTRLTAELTDAVQTLLTRDPRFDTERAADRAASADLVLALCGGAVRTAVKEWALAPEKLNDNSTHQLERRANALATDLLERLR